MNGGYYGFHWLKDVFNQRYLSIIEEFSSAIAGQLFAHHHTDSVKIFLNSTGHPVSQAFLVPGRAQSVLSKSKLYHQVCLQ